MIWGSLREKLSAQDILKMVTEKYDVFHIIVEEGSHMSYARERTINEWTDLLGQRAMLLSDHTKLGEVIVSAIQMNEGAKKEDIVKSWDGSTGLVVAKAIDNFGIVKADDSGLVRFR